MSKEVTIYGYNSVETSVSKNPDSVIELYVDKTTSNKRIDKLLSSTIASKLNIKKVDYNFLKPDYSPTVNEQINQTNTILKNNKEFEVVDLHPLFLNNESILNSSLSSDGIHINSNGYQIWVEAIKTIIKNLNRQA